MKIQILAFGIARDIIGSRSLEWSVAEGFQMSDLREKLCDDFPKLKELRDLHLALNCEYTDGSEIIRESDEIAIIPPVSGG
jgi:molybdopterin synthase sulfur carrier subunit